MEYEKEKKKKKKVCIHFKNKKKTFHTFVCLLIMMFSHVTHMYPLKVEGRGLKFRSVPPLKVKENVIYIYRERVREGRMSRSV